MDAVQPPEGRHGMEHHMLQIESEVEHQQRDHHCCPLRQLQPVQHAYLLGRSKEGDCVGNTADGGPHQDRVERREPKIGHPALTARVHKNRSWPCPLAQRHQRKTHSRNAPRRTRASILVLLCSAANSHWEFVCRQSATPSSRRTARNPCVCNSSTAWAANTQ